MNDLRLIILVHPEYRPVHEEIKYLEEKRKKYELEREKWVHFGNVELENFKKLNEKKEKKTFSDYFDYWLKYPSFGFIFMRWEGLTAESKKAYVNLDEKN